MSKKEDEKTKKEIMDHIAIQGSSIARFIKDNVQEKYEGGAFNTLFGIVKLTLWLNLVCQARTQSGSKDTIAHIDSSLLNELLALEYVELGVDMGPEQVAKMSWKDD